MTIGVDGNEANVEKRVGVSVYTLSLLNYFKKQSNKNLNFIIYLKNFPLSDLPIKNNYFRYEVVPGKILWTQIFLPLKLYQKKEINVFFSPVHYIPRFCPVPTVVTIHDLAYLYFKKDFLAKDLFQLENWTKFSINKAKKIIAVSEFTKKDIIKSYGVPENKLTVVYNGFEKSKNKNFELNKNLKLKIKNFILFVGTIQPRKNLTILIETFDKFIQTNKDFKLVIAGKKGWLFEDIFKKVKDMKLEKKVIFTDHVSDQQIVWLYKNAFCLVLPSLYEGFGLPVLEAMSYDCPTVVSATSSLKEIGGDASLYFEPKNSSDLLKQLELLKNNQELRTELIRKGNVQLKKFSWETCGRQTLEVIKQAILK